MTIHAQWYKKKRVHVFAIGILYQLGLCYFLLQHLLNAPMKNSVIAVNVDLSAPYAVSNFSMGATHTQYSADSWNNPQAVASAQQLLKTALHYQNQHIMGWGTGDPEPSPGVYQWADLDERIQLMRHTNAHIVLTLCCAPGWMRPEGYQDDWKNLEIAPDATHIQDFAHLAAQVAQRYPDIKYFQVWNELKGMWSTSPGATIGLLKQNRWDYERYTTLYNAVYDAVKHVRPDALIGGPYVVINSNANPSTSNPGPTYAWGTLDQRSLDVLSYWLKNKHGADFITIDSNTLNDDQIWKEDEFRSAQKFADIVHWIRQQSNGGSTLPIWWAEWYAGHPDSAPHSLAYYNALMASDEIYTILSGSSSLFLWGTQGDAEGFALPETLFTDTRNTEGGKATPYYTTSCMLQDYFGPGTQLYKANTSATTITVLASTKKVLLVNHLAIEQKIALNSTVITLQPYEVRLVNTPQTKK
ncbi:MAG TPA: hypothetical protein VL461_08825 [Dictyobacter sp.]|jgi:hypothetical protein|nr:hypothetical protein [Dictyobacter sp.]